MASATLNCGNSASNSETLSAGTKAIQQRQSASKIWHAQEKPKQDPQRPNSYFKVLCRFYKTRKQTKSSMAAEQKKTKLATKYLNFLASTVRMWRLLKVLHIAWSVIKVHACKHSVTPMRLATIGLRGCVAGIITISARIMVQHRTQCVILYDQI